MTPEAQFHMIDVGTKPVTARLAVACGSIDVGEDAFALIRDRQLPKGDVLMLAEVAGIQGAKNAAGMIPLCHPMGLDQVRVMHRLNAVHHRVQIFCLASTHARTGVEMEALAGATAALLCIWDLTKMIEPDLHIHDVRLLIKTGGKSGIWLNPDGVPDDILAWARPETSRSLAGRKTICITLSDRAHAGTYEDRSGPVLAQWLRQAGAEVIHEVLLPDDQSLLEEQLGALTRAHQPHLIICTGGTGVALRDRTPEAIAAVCDRLIPGVGELLRQDGQQYTPLSWSSRSQAGTLGQTLILALPGNPNAVREGMMALLPKVLPHLIKTLRGE
jgi:molybdenum cofactor biosynthesis protein MoaC